mgnify:CR=1 FL=1
MVAPQQNPLSLQYSEPEMQDISRQRKLSELLLAQGMQGSKGQMVGNIYVPAHPFEHIADAYSIYKSGALSKEADKKAQEYAEQLRRLGVEEARDIVETQLGRPAQAQVLATPENLPQGQTLLDEMDQKTLVQAARPELKGNLHAAYIKALSGRSPQAQALAQILGKKVSEGPKWEKATIPNADGSERHGWVDVNSPNPLNTFVEGGTKPPYSPLDAAKFTFDTGMQPPPWGAQKPNAATGGVTKPTGGSTVVQPSAQTQSVVQTGNQVVAPAGGRINAPSGKAAQEVMIDKLKRQEQYKESLPQDLNTAQNTIDIIDKMIGDAEVVNGDWKVKQGGREPHAGFNQFVGATWRPFAHMIEGSDPAGFKALYNQVKGATFLEAFGRLRGGGSITEVEGAKAEAALNRMNKAQSEAEFIEAAREFQQNLRKGMELAKQKAGVPNRANTLATPSTPSRNTPPKGITQREWDSMSESEKALWK